MLASKVLLSAVQGVKQHLQKKMSQALMDNGVMEQILKKLHESTVKDPGYQNNKLKLRSSMLRVFAYYQDVYRAEEAMKQKLQEVREAYDPSDHEAHAIAFGKSLRQLQIGQQMQFGEASKIEQGAGSVASEMPFVALSTSNEWEKLKNVGIDFSQKAAELLSLEQIVKSAGASDAYADSHVASTGPMTAGARMAQETPNGRLGQKVLDSKIDEMLGTLDMQVFNFIRETVEREFVQAAVTSITDHLSRATIEKGLNAWYGSVSIPIPVPLPSQSGAAPSARAVAAIFSFRQRRPRPN